MRCIQAAEAQLHLADLWLELRVRDLGECVGQVLGVMPLVLGNGSREQRALLHWTLAMLYLKTWSADDLRAAPHRSTGHALHSGRPWLLCRGPWQCLLLMGDWDALTCCFLCVSTWVVAAGYWSP